MYNDEVHTLWKVAIAVVANVAGLLVAAHYVPGFLFSGSIRDILVAGAILTVLNLILRPIIKLFLGPLIVLTLGIGTIVVNAVILEVLTKLTPGLTIQSASALLLATLILGATNLIFHLITNS